MSHNEWDDFFNKKELNEIFESETEREDEISNTDVMQKTKFLNPPTSEDDIVGGWSTCIFSNSKCTTLYIGKAEKQFLGDVDGLYVSVELD